MLLSDPTQYAVEVPHQEFSRRRREAPVSWVDEGPLLRHTSAGRAEFTGSGYWAVTRHATVTAASRQPDVFSSGALGAFLPDPKSAQDLERTRQLLINMDAPQHTALRALVSDAFRPAAVRRLNDNIRMHANLIVERLLEKEQFDIVADLAAELPLLVLADLLGVPREDRRLLYEWSNQIVGFDDPEYGGGDIERYQRTFGEAYLYARDMAVARRGSPRDDLVSEIVNRDLDGRRISDVEFCHLWILLVIGGNESTRHLLSAGLQALAECTRERDRLVADEALIPSAVEELLRWVSPIMQFRRTAMRQVKLDGQRINEGDKVVLYYVSANRDEEVFAEPHRLDLARMPNPHVAFGVGPHFCLGAHLARLETASLLSAVRPHLTRLALTGRPVRLASNFMNGIKSLPARFASPK
jgi:cytochrome P450